MAARSYRTPTFCDTNFPERLKRRIEKGSIGKLEMISVVQEIESMRRQILAGTMYKLPI